jgi:methylmalonyl-CoA epimerase
MKAKMLDHVVVRVQNIEDGIATFRDRLGMTLSHTGENEALGIKQAMFKMDNGSFIEVVAPLGPETPVGKALEKNGEGVHTVSIAVENLEGTIKQLETNGAKVVAADLKRGMAFIHPKSAHGLMIQLIERK